MAKKVSFWATKYVSKKEKVSFKDKHGRRVSFIGTKSIPKKVRVSFWAAKKSRRFR